MSDELELDPEKPEQNDSEKPAFAGGRPPHGAALSVLVWVEDEPEPTQG